jgi:hypothetical protein
VFEYDDDPAYGSPEYTSAEITVLTHKPPAIALGSFYWRVRAKDAAGNWSPWSAARMVTITPPKPSSPVLLNPKSGTFTNNITPTLEWASVAYGQLYEIQISKSYTFKILVDTHTGNGLNYTSIALADGTYYWRVRAKNMAGVNGSWSSYRTVKVDTLAPSTPVLSAPANNSTMVGTPTFKWLAASGAKYYVFEYDDDPAFGSPEYTSAEITVLTHKPPAIALGIFYWHVRAKDIAGNWSPWSTPRLVTVNNSTTTKTLTVQNTGAGSGLVTSEPTGINCGSICQMNTISGLSITLTAQADLGSTFIGWSGSGCSGVGTCVVTMDVSKSVIATFNSDPYVLTLTKAGTGNGTVSSSPTGINCGSTCSSNYDYNTSVTLTAAPSAGSTFTGWSGGGCSGTGSCVVTMDAAKSVTATFTLNTYVLTVSKSGTGSGLVTGSPTGINCGSTCSASHNYNTSVTLTATPSSGSTFTGWSGSGCSGTGSCVVTMDSAKTVTATFTLSTYSLNITKSGTGSGTVSSSPAGINCGSTCSASYNYNTQVTLTATASAGSTFTGWSGSGCSGTGSCVVTMDAAKSVTATFTTNSYMLTVSKAGTGSGTVSSSPAGINCGSTCSASYNYNTSVTLTATPSSGSTFTGWSGSGCSGTGTCVVTMDAAKSVTATFDLGSVILFQDDFSTNLNQWALWGDPQPAIDNDIGNPSPGYRNRGDGMFNSGALSNMVFTPTPGMEISVDLRINSTGLHWIGLGFSRIFDPGDNHEDTRILVGMGVDTNNYYILDCSQNPVAKDVFHHFKFVVRNDYKVDAYMGSTETYVCTSGFTLSEFVDKPLILWGRDGYADNVLVVQN